MFVRRRFCGSIATCRRSASTCIFRRGCIVSGGISAGTICVGVGCGGRLCRIRPRCPISRSIAWIVSRSHWRTAPRSGCCSGSCFRASCGSGFSRYPASCRRGSVWFLRCGILRGCGCGRLERCWGLRWKQLKTACFARPGSCARRWENWHDLYCVRGESRFLLLGRTAGGNRRGGRTASGWVRCVPGQ